MMINVVLSSSYKQISRLIRAISESERERLISELLSMRGHNGNH